MKKLEKFMWPAASIVTDAATAIRAGDHVEIALPASFHHVVFRHLHPEADAGGTETLDVVGGSEVLAKLASIAGLEGLSELQKEVEHAGFQVSLFGAPPVLRLNPSSGNRTGMNDGEADTKDQYTRSGGL